MREYGFELSLCAHLEAENRLVSRQLGAHVHGRRIADTVLVEPGPSFDARAAITDQTIPDRAIEAEVSVGQARDWRRVFPDLRPDRVRSLIDRAVEVGFFERERRNGRLAVRQTTRYPDRWFDRLVGVENKPDLNRPGDLAAQLRRDVALGLFDEVVLATASYVTGAHRNRVPDPVGIWRFDPETGEREVVREATPLNPEEGAAEILEEQPGQTEIRLVDAAEKRRARRRLAERAYGKGWRPDGLPACAKCDPGQAPLDSMVPFCTYHDRIVEEAVECGPECPGYEPADPPSFDPEQVRAEKSAWALDPDGRQRRQAGLDRFG